MGLYDETVFALSELGSGAQSGSIVATFTLDGTEREHVRCGGRRSSQGLGPRHHRWELFAAAKSGDAAALRELAGRGISLAQPLLGYHGWTALHLAARAGSVDAVQVLLRSCSPSWLCRAKGRESGAARRRNTVTRCASRRAIATWR